MTTNSQRGQIHTNTVTYRFKLASPCSRDKIFLRLKPYKDTLQTQFYSGCTSTHLGFIVERDIDDSGSNTPEIPEDEGEDVLDKSADDPDKSTDELDKSADVLEDVDDDSEDFAQQDADDFEAMRQTLQQIIKGSINKTTSGPSSEYESYERNG